MDGLSGQRETGGTRARASDTDLTGTKDSLDDGQGLIGQWERPETEWTRAIARETDWTRAVARN
jgi:hypothetical protein